MATQLVRGTAAREAFADLETLKVAAHAMAYVTDRLAPDDLDRPSPCADWTVGDVVDHLVRTLDLAASLLDGGAPEPARRRDAGAVRRASRRLIIAADAADLSVVHATPIGRLSGGDLVAHTSLDLLAHAWDVAAGARITAASLDDEVCERALRYAVQSIPDAHRGAHLAPAVAVDPNAPAEARLMGFLGRNPRWRPPLAV